MNDPSTSGIAALNHAGGLLEAGRVFTAPPPAEIGTVRSAFSTHRAGRIDVRGWLVALTSAAALGVATWFAFTVEFHLGWVITVPTGIAMAILVIVGLFPRPTCTYVGDLGIARVMPGTGKPLVSTYLFTPASTVRVELTRVRANGIYTGTEYTFLFSTPSSGQTFRISGKYFERGKRPVPTDNVWHFGEAAEKALTDFLLPEAIGRISHGKVETFRLRSGVQMDLGANALTIWTGDDRADVPYADMIDVEAAGGEVLLRAKSGAPGFDANGPEAGYKFIYAQMLNARVFYTLLQRQIAAVA